MRSSITLALLMFMVSVQANDLLWKKLQQEPNMIVLIRNSVSGGNRDGRNMLAWDKSGNCKGESNLTLDGKAHAKRIGQKFIQQGIEALAITSPMCRCRETAKIAFGNYISDPELRQSTISDTNRQLKFQTKAKQLLTKHRGTKPIVFINHRPNIDILTMELLSLGEMVIGQVNDTGEVEVMGKIRID